VSSLKQLIEQGQYQRAACRIICGVVQVYLERCTAGASGSEGDIELRGMDGGDAHTRPDADG
jgi:hypothetical protein